jgi:hypothetical protein
MWRTSSLVAVLLTLQAAWTSLATADENDARERAKRGGEVASTSEALTAVPEGQKTVYIGVGVSSQNGIGTAVECTSYVADGSLYPFPVTVEFYEKGGSRVGVCTIDFDHNGRTQTFVTNPIGAYVNDCNAGSSAIGQGSLRVIAPKKQAANLSCNAQVIDLANPPGFSHDLPLTRVGKLKAPKDT